MSSPVSRRKVFYIPGYDPFPPRRYRELYRSEGADQARISGYEIALSAVKGTASGWRVEAVIDGHTTQTEIEVLVWSDIVKHSMGHGVIATYRELLQTAWIYISTGALRRLVRLRKGPTLAALYPVAMLLVQLGLAIGAGGLISMWLDQAILRMAVWIAVTSLMLVWFQRMDRKFYAYYLMHDYAFSARWRGANPPALETRLDQFRTRIADALASDIDEVLVVGHSSGAHLGVSILADLTRDAPWQRALGFLSLGHVVPMMSFLPGADKLRADLHDLSQCCDITWVDVTAPGDGCAFALCDPVAVSGVAPHDKRWPLVISAAFTQTLSPAKWAALRWRFFRLHFQYLCAFDRPGDYDYFQITAGPMTLSDRFATRAPSNSRVETPLSPYTDRASR